MDLNSHKKEFDKVIEHFKGEASSIRTGRAVSSLVDEISVEHYGGKYQIKELASISIPEPKTILIQPWDKSSVESIVKAIKNSNLGLNPISDGQGVRLVMPALTEERRKEFIKLLKQKMEVAHIAVRNIRGQIWDDIQEAEKAGKIREGDKFKAKDDLQKIVDEYNGKIEEIEKKKEEELMM
ncbi:MAG: ribosome recycling factor [bacterium]|nr:ribosome recycling factor [bacterium]